MHVGDDLHLIAVGVVMLLQRLTARYMVVGVEVVVMVVIGAFLEVGAIGSIIGVFDSLAIILGVSGALEEGEEVLSAQAVCFEVVGSVIVVGGIVVIPFVRVVVIPLRLGGVVIIVVEITFTDARVGVVTIAISPCPKQPSDLPSSPLVVRTVLAKSVNFEAMKRGE